MPSDVVLHLYGASTRLRDGASLEAAGLRDDSEVCYHLQLVRCQQLPPPGATPSTPLMVSHAALVSAAAASSAGTAAHLCRVAAATWAVDPEALEVRLPPGEWCGSKAAPGALDHLLAEMEAAPGMRNVWFRPVAVA